MIGFLKELSWFIKKHWYLYISILIVGIINILLILLPAQIVGEFTKKLDNNQLTFDFILYNIFLTFIVLIGIIYLVSSTKRILQNRLKVRLYYALQTRYIENILVQDASFFEDYHSGDLLTRALGDVRSVNFSGGNRLLNIFLEFMTIVCAFIVMMFISIPLTLISVLPLSLIFIINMILRRKVKRNWRQVREASSQMGNMILESITNVKTIRAFSKEEEDYQKNIKYSNAVYKIEKRNLKINVSFQPIFQSIVSVAIILAYFFGARFIIDPNNKLEVSDLIKFLIYLNMFSGPLTSIGNMLMNFYQSFISLDRLNEIYHAKSSVVDSSLATTLKRVDKIEFKNFSFKYPMDNDFVLNGINLTITKGETIGIVGKTGSGKSTLVRQLIRQYPIENETLFINDLDVSLFKKESVRQKISYVPQEHILFSRSVLKNVELGSLEDVTQDDIDNAIIKADFKKDIENLPYGLDTVVGEYGVTLSGGQKQRLAIARAFMKNSDVLVLDDSLSAVDGKTEATIIKNLKEFRNNLTNIIIAHRLSAVMHANKIIVLDKGRIIESGNHDELMEKKGWYYKLFLEQQMNFIDEDNEK